MEYRIIDCDQHVIEPPDLWERYLPKKHQDKAPKRAKDKDGGDAWQLEAWSQIPKRVLLQHFLEGYKNSLIVAVPAGILAVLDYLLMSRLRVTWWFRGILLPLAAFALATGPLQSVSGTLPTLLVTGLLLAVAYRLFDLLVGRFFRGIH